MIQFSMRENLYSPGGNMIITNFNHKPKNICPPHWHQYGEFIYVQDGEITVTVNERSYLLKPDSMLCIFPCEVHSIQSEKDPRTFLIQFDQTLINRFPSVMLCLQKVHIRKSLIEKEQSPELFYKLNSLLSSIIALDKESQQKRVPFHDVHQYILLCQMLLLMLKKEQNALEQTIPDALENRQDVIQIMQAVCSHIDQNFTDEITQAQLAKDAGMSISYFSKIFRQYTGYSFNAYLSRCRLSHAKMLLADSSRKITDIAFLSGFGSLASFNRIFSEYEGMSPSEFRRLYNNS